MYEAYELRHQTEPATLDEAQLVIAGLADVIARQAHDLRHDTLIPTMLNKAALKELVAERVADAKAFGIFMIDIDKFKQINDTHGHVAGDEVLMSLGEAISLGEALQNELKRETDTLKMTHGRFGGDEFVAIVELSENDRRAADPADQMDNAQKMLRTIEDKFLDEYPHLRDLGVGLSIGSAVFDPSAPVTPDELLKQADQVMYEDKARRRASV